MSHVFGGIIVLLILFHYAHQEPQIVEEDKPVSITCEPARKGSLVLWFRVLKNSIDFIGSFDANGNPKNKPDNPFEFDKSSKKLTLKKFKKERDTGLYACTSINSNALLFGKVTRLQGPADPKTTVKTPAVAAMTVPKQTPNPTSSSCQCKPNTATEKLASGMSCSIMIWAPVAGGCGLLFIILIITICHCNRLRTRRCPHHYKRKPKKQAPVRQASPDRYI